MSAKILALWPNRHSPRDWNAQEMAEFYRVVDALGQAGITIGLERGLTDEGDPWASFFRPETCEVIAHFALIDGAFVADGAALSQPVRGRDLRDVLNRVINTQGLLMPPRGGSQAGRKLFFHPAALLTAFIATSLLEMESAQAGTLAEPESADGRNEAPRAAAGRGPALRQSDGTGQDTGIPLHLLTTAIAAAIGLAAAEAGAHEDDLATLLPASETGRTVGAESTAPGLGELDTAPSARPLPAPLDDQGAGEPVPGQLASDPFALTQPQADALHALIGRAVAGQHDILVADAIVGAALPDTLGRVALAEPQLDDGALRSLQRSSEPTSPEARELPVALVDFFSEGAVRGEALNILFPGLLDDADDTGAIIWVILGEGSEGPDTDADGVPDGLDGARTIRIVQLSDLIFDAQEQEVLTDLVSFIDAGQDNPIHLTPDQSDDAYDLARTYAGSRGELPYIVVFRGDEIALESFAFTSDTIFVSDLLFDWDFIDSIDNDPLVINVDSGEEILVLGVVAYNEAEAAGLL